jgi:hypothetical protein
MKSEPWTEGERLGEPEDCICDFPADCDGSGLVECIGCGGDFCVCAACAGHGTDECEGCVACYGEPDEQLEREEG